MLFRDMVEFVASESEKAITLTAPKSHVSVPLKAMRLPTILFRTEAEILPLLLSRFDRTCTPQRGTCDMKFSEISVSEQEEQ